MPGYLESKGYSKTQRRNLYLTVCMAVRMIPIILLLAGYYDRNVLMLLAAIGIIGNLSPIIRGDNNVWWSRKLQAVISLLIFIAAYNNDVETIISLLTISILSGLLLASAICPFS
jgi:hypothetical protein